MTEQADCGDGDQEGDAGVDGRWLLGPAGVVQVDRRPAAGHRLLGRPSADEQYVKDAAYPTEIILRRCLGHSGGVRQDGMTVGADPDAAGVADVQRHSGIAGELRGHNERLQRRCSCRRARGGVCDLAQGTAGNPICYYDTEIGRSG
jgi:hypothetical protein